MRGELRGELGKRELRGELRGLYRLDALGLSLEFGLVDRRLALDPSRLRPGLSLRLRCSRTLHRCTLEVKGRVCR